MSLAKLIRLKPAGAWRIGPDSGAGDRVDRVYHSDTLYSAISIAMAALGWRDEWFAATALSEEGSAARLTSLFPALGADLLVPAPAPLWPPPNVTRLRARGARFIPARLVAALAAGEPWREDNWEVDGLSDCLVRRGHLAEPSGPYRIALRSRAAVDRVDTGTIAVHRAACLEFAPNAGLWCAVEFASEAAQAIWEVRIEACFRLLADTGLGGERSNGWGHFSIEQWESGELRELVLGASAIPSEGEERAYWLLSLFSPGAGDNIDWSRGSYEFLDRSGRVESLAEWGAVKKSVRMVKEGSVLLSSIAPRGSAPDAAPEGFPHPVYRAGFAVAISIPWRVNA